MSVSLKLAARYMAGRKLRTALTTLSIVIGVMLIFGLNGLMPGMMEMMKRSMLASVGEVDLSVESASGALFDPNVVRRVAHVSGVRAATPVLRRTVALPAKPDYHITTLNAVGIDPESASAVRPYPIGAGRMLRATDNVPGASRPAAVIPLTTAEKMGLRVGSTLTLPSAQGTTDFEVVGTIDSAVPPASDEVYLPLAVAQRIFGAGQTISSVEAAYGTNADRAQVERTVRAVLGSDYALGTLAADSPLTAGFKVAGTIFNVLGGFALAMGGFIILNTFRTIVAERRHDIGMLRAIGASRQMILGLFLTESILQGLLGTFVGIVAGWGFAVFAANALGKLVNDLVRMGDFSVSFAPSTWATAVFLGVGVTVLSAIVPARAAANVTPLDALRPQMGDVYERAATRRAWVGLGLIVLAVLGLLSGNSGMIALGALLLLTGMSLGASAAMKPITDIFSRAIELIYAREGSLARANLQRNPGRAAVTASAVMISIALVAAIMAMTRSVVDGYAVYAEKTTGTDFLVLPQGLLFSGGAVGAGPDLVNEVRNTRGMGDVATLRYAPGVVNGKSVQVVGIDPATYLRIASFRYSDGSSDAEVGRLKLGNFAVANGSFRGQTGTNKGDRVRVTTPNGIKTFTIVAGGNDYINAKLPTLYLSQEALARYWNVNTDVMILANATPGADRTQVLKSLQATIDRFPAFKLYDAAAWQSVQTNLFAQMRVMYYFMAVLLAAPALLALLNTLAIGVLARTREIGMLRAVGATRRQVKRLVVAESVLLASVGTVAGVVAGIPLGYVIMDSIKSLGLEMPFVFPSTGLLVSVAIGLAFAVLAALIPARQAAKLDVIRALRFE